MPLIETFCISSVHSVVVVVIVLWFDSLTQSDTFIAFITTSSGLIFALGIYKIIVTGFFAPPGNHLVSHGSSFSSFHSNSC